MPQNGYDYHLTEEIGGFRDTVAARFILAANLHLNNFILPNTKTHASKCSEMGKYVN